MAKAAKLTKWLRFKLLIRRIGAWLYINIKFAIIIALFGGVPGVINLWNWTHQHPNFYFYTEAMSDGRLRSAKHGNYKFFILSGGIYNGGSEPLFPTTFEIRLKYKNGNNYSIRSQPTEIFKEELSNLGGLPTRLNLDSDLLKVPKIKERDAAYGIILFVTPLGDYDTTLTPYDLTYAYVTCRDILNKKRVTKIDLKRLLATKETVILPKSGFKQLP